MLHRFEMGSADFARDFITLNKKKIVNLSPTTRALLSSAIPNYAASSSPPQAGLEVQTAAFPVVQQGGTDQPTMRTPMVVIALVVLVGLAALFYWQMQQRVIRKSAVIIDNRPGNSTRTQYSTYYNERFGFTLEYPASFIPREVPTNGDGLTFSSPSGDAELTTAAGNNSGSTVGDLYKMSLQNVTGQVRYNRIGANWFVISWDDGERIGYTRMFAGNGSQNSFTFMYPKQRAHEYNKTVIHLEASFRPGDLSRGW
jgi:hypothetical protein